MCSYKKLAILTLAASSVSPALSAPFSFVDDDGITKETMLGGLGVATAASLGAGYLMNKEGKKQEGLTNRATGAPESWPIAELEGRTLGDYDHTERGLSLKSVRALLAANDMLTKGNPGAPSKRRINHKALDKAFHILGDIAEGAAILLRRADVLPEDLVSRALNELD